MIKVIRQWIFAWRYRKAVRKAVRLHESDGRKYFVILMGGKLRVVAKQTVSHLVRTRRFRKGVRTADIEKKALFVTK